MYERASIVYGLYAFLISMFGMSISVLYLILNYRTSTLAYLLPISIFNVFDSLALIYFTYVGKHTINWHPFGHFIVMIVEFQNLYRAYEALKICGFDYTDPIFFRTAAIVVNKFLMMSIKAIQQVLNIPLERYKID